MMLTGQRTLSDMSQARQ